MSVAEWRTHMMATYNLNKAKNPNATLREAMLEAKGTWKTYKSNLGSVRQNMVKHFRSEAKKHPKGAAERKGLKERANHLEVQNAANVLRDMRND